VPVARIPSEIPGLIAELLQRRRTRLKNGAAKKAAEAPKANGKSARASGKASAPSRALANGRGGSARPKKTVAATASKAGGRSAGGKKKKR